MAVYRIKKQSPDPPETEKTWQTPPTAKQARNLDLDEIEELNRLPVEADEEETLPLRRGYRLVIALALTICLCLGGVWLYQAYVHHLPSLDFLGQSAQLSQDQRLAQLRTAVVSIQLPQSQGSGFNISPQGVIVTNRHVAEGGGNLNIHFADGQVYSARDWQVVGDYDLALVRLNSQDLPFVPLSAELPAAGETVTILGSPLGFNWTLSQGEVVGYWQQEEGQVPLMVLSGPLYPGSSGSPVFNEAGQVVAVVFAAFTDQDRLGLAIPAAVLLEQLGDDWT